MKRQIIKINEELCDGCGLCANGCPEGAIKVICGKARLVGEIFCDGLGACTGSCPRGAIKVEQREAEPYDEIKTMENIVKAGTAVIAAHLSHLYEHGQETWLGQAEDFLKACGLPVPEYRKQSASHCGCASSAMVDRRGAETECAAGDIPSQLRQWPVQLHLLNPAAPYFDNAELLIAADCTAFACGNFHRDILRGKIAVVFCPKLDDSTRIYVDKLAEILRTHEIKSVTVAHMTVPCCLGAVKITEEAVKLSGKNIPVKTIVVALDGKIVEQV